jgi:hypothetical protein
VAYDFRLRVHQQQKAWLAALNQPEQEQLIAALHRLQTSLASDNQ